MDPTTVHAPTLFPVSAPPASTGVMARYGITFDEVAELVDENPSLRAFVVGYAAERRVRDLLRSGSGVVDLGKPDDHDRSAAGDRVVRVGGVSLRVEVKSVQSATVRVDAAGGRSATWQCDASDKRTVALPDGTQLATTCLVVGGFDLVAVNCFELFGEWRFAFARPETLDRSRFRGYTDEQRQWLLAGSQRVTVDADGRFTDARYRPEPWSFLAELAAERAGRAA